MSVLVIGSRGFLGSNLYYHFKRFEKTYGCDIFPAPYDSDYFYVDSADPDYESFLKTGNFDFCINCSGSADVQKSLKNPLNDFYCNVVVLERLLNSLRLNAPACKFINISSAAVYGNPQIFPIKVGAEETPLSPYGYHKLMADKMVEEYAKVFGLQTCTIRIFSAYGNGQKRLFLWDAIEKLIDDKNIDEVTFYGTGNESRDYIHVQDIIQQVNLIRKNAFFCGEIYNVANGREVLIHEVAEIIRKELGKNCTIRFSGLVRPGDPLNWLADISPLLEWGYKQSIPLEYGIREYVKWALGRD